MHPSTRSPEALPQQICVMIVDDHAVVRRGLSDLLAERREIAVVGEAATARESLEVAARVQPDVVIMDLRLPDGSGVEACREIRNLRPTTRVLMLTSYADRNALFAGMESGRCSAVPGLGIQTRRLGSTRYLPARRSAASSSSRRSAP